MKVQPQPPLHLTYCLNVHPGETWAENFAAIREKAMAVRTRVAPGAPFGLGLRLSRQAADSLEPAARRRDVRTFLDDHGLYVFTINGFPYGAFHGARVKEQVYAPDWRTPERREYTNRLADILASLLPDDVSGSISTVPVSYKPWIAGESDVKAAVANLRACADRLAGSRICLALEPEPGCVLETAGETIRFFREFFPDAPNLGVCFDTCHAAVQFEDPAASLRQIADAGIRIAKIQLSAALEMAPPWDSLEPFRDAVYLHQTRALMSDGSFRSWADLPAAIDDGVRRLRVHFHVPLYAGGSTAAALTPEFFRLLRDGVTEHVEIETYTFDVLPEALRKDGVVEQVVREYEWVLKRL